MPCPRRLEPEGRERALQRLADDRGDTVWLVENANAGSALVAFRATTGAPRFQARLAGPGYVAPTVAGDRVYVPLYTGGMQGFALVSVLGRQSGGGGAA